MQKTVFIGTTLNQSSTNDYFQEIYRQFVLKGYRVVIFTDKKRNDLVSLTTNPIILTWPSNRPTNFKDAIFLIKQIRKYNPSTIIANFGSVNLMTLIGFLFRIKHRLVWIRTLSTQLDKASKFKMYRKFLVYKLSTKIIANSFSMKEDAHVTYSIPKDKIFVNVNAVNIPDKRLDNHYKYTLIYVGRLHVSKGVDILIKAINKIKKTIPNIDLLIVGSGDEELALKKLVSDLKLNNNIQFMGAVPKKQVLELFSNSLIAVVPSRNEAFGYVVIEAMSVGAVVIGSKTGGIAEIITDNYDGILFENGNDLDLASKILKIIHDKELSRTIASNAYSTVSNKYNIKKVALQFVEKINNNFEK